MLDPLFVEFCELDCFLVLIFHLSTPQTVLLQNMYQNPNNQTQNPGGQPVVSPEEEQRHFDEFFEVL